MIHQKDSPQTLTEICQRLRDEDETILHVMDGLGAIERIIAEGHATAAEVRETLIAHGLAEYIYEVEGAREPGDLMELWDTRAREAIFDADGNILVPKGHTITPAAIAIMARGFTFGETPTSVYMATVAAVDGSHYSDDVLFEVVESDRQDAVQCPKVGTRGTMGILTATYPYATFTFRGDVVDYSTGERIE